MPVGDKAYIDDSVSETILVKENIIKLTNFSLDNLHYTKQVFLRQ